MCALLEWSLCFPHSCGAHKIKPYESSKPNALGFPLANARPQARDPDEGLRTLIPLGELCNTIIFEFVVHPHGEYGI